MTSDRAYRTAMPAEEALAEVLPQQRNAVRPCRRPGLPQSVYQQRSVGTVHHGHLANAKAATGGHAELSEPLKQAIAEAAGRDGEL